MTPAEYRESRKRTMNHDLSPEHQKLNAALGLGEAGEVQNIVKKEVFHGHAPDPTKILDESGDILFYLDWLLESYNWTLEDAFSFNRKKLTQRYPEGFSATRSIHRLDGGSV